ncbi:phosphotransferase family protein [Actinokineospora soli]|uniref:Phosphotransferase family protein n=1 Tax=Actinokineospora soli TaxID=1048753 RepID=A0ABW2TNB8_9PSEU
MPRVVRSDDSALLMTECPGTPWWEVREQVDAELHGRLRAEVGRGAAALHRVTGPGFGYPQFGLAATWAEAFQTMVDALAGDADRFGVDVPAARLAKAVDAGRERLAAVAAPALVHFDLWPGNILLHDGRVGGIIDGERAFWGDPLAELASLGLFEDVERDTAFASGYREAGGSLEFTPDTRWRLAAYQAYLYLIMLVEGAPRGYGGPDREATCAWVGGRLRAALDVVGG